METKIEILKTEYWSKSDAFILPLTGLKKEHLKFNSKSYLFWNRYGINDYNLILTFDSEKYDEVMTHCKKHIFPILDKHGYLIESYDISDKIVLVMDISYWAKDIELFMIGKYSKFSDEAKKQVERFHTFNRVNIPIHIYSVLHPRKKLEILENMNSIEYISDSYGISLDDLEKIGEVGSTYDIMTETLLLESSDICQSVTKE